jgi:hypothetical protein
VVAATGRPDTAAEEKRPHDRLLACEATTKRRPQTNTKTSQLQPSSPEHGPAVSSRFPRQCLQMTPSFP